MPEPHVTVERLASDLAMQLRAVRDTRDKELSTAFLAPAVDVTTLSCVGPSHRASSVRIKLRIAHIIIMYDDYVDSAAIVDPTLVRALLQIPHRLLAVGGFKSEAQRPEAFVQNTWLDVLDEMARLPKYTDLLPLLEFDITQLHQAFRFAQALRTVPGAAHPKQNLRWLSHDFGFVLAGMVDLMASPEFDLAELGRARELFSQAQRVARLHNDLTSLEKEIAEGDPSNEVIIRARKLETEPTRGGVAFQQVEADLGGEERRLEKVAARLQSFDGLHYVAGVRELLDIQARYYAEALTRLSKTC